MHDGKITDFYLFILSLLPTFAPVLRYRVIGQYVLLITRAFKRYYPVNETSTISELPDNRQQNAHVLFLVISVHRHCCMHMFVWMYKIKGRELLFISVSKAVEGLDRRYINSPHASFIFYNHPLGD